MVMLADLDELRAMFTGVPAEDGDWATTPCHTAGLAYEIARRTDPTSTLTLLRLLYDTTPLDEIPATARDACNTGVQRYLVERRKR